MVNATHFLIIELKYLISEVNVHLDIIIFMTDSI